MNIEVTEEGVVYCDRLTCLSPMACLDCPLLQFQNFHEKEPKDYAII